MLGLEVLGGGTGLPCAMVSAWGTLRESGEATFASDFADSFSKPLGEALGAGFEDTLGDALNLGPNPGPLVGPWELFALDGSLGAGRNDGAVAGEQLSAVS